MIVVDPEYQMMDSLLQKLNLVIQKISRLNIIANLDKEFFISPVEVVEKENGRDVCLNVVNIEF